MQWYHQSRQASVELLVICSYGMSFRYDELSKSRAWNAGDNRCEYHGRHGMVYEMGLSGQCDKRHAKVAVGFEMESVVINCRRVTAGVR